ncbi:MAG: MMPL family transporter [Cyanobacteria bacterium RM1_2_2]|nr:MMPL family transporter [Cyanobacteria bacterium RM1_2_2]
MAIFSIADTFIKRPVLTTVCTILIVLLGGICIPLLPVMNLPDIAPIQVQVTSAYIGADAQTVENTVTTTLERGINGVEDMEYMTSQSANTGASAIQVYFSTDTDKNINQVNVQNRVSQNEATLPDAVKQTGVTVKTASTSILLVYGFNSKDNIYDQNFISNYLDLYINDAIKRVPGVGDLSVLGERKYAMRLWLDPNATAARGLTAADVSTALRSQNIQVGAGSVGGQPAPSDQSYSFPLRVSGRLQNEAEFGELVLKTNSDGSLVKVKDVGRVELGAENYDTNVLANGQPGVALAIYQQPGSNAIDVANKIRETLAELRRDFPPGLQDSLVYDITDFIESSQEEVLHTLIEAILLVILVIFIFLQDWRTTVIPAVAIPVSLIGTMAFAKALGFSLNTLTMFGLVLATGLVVDDGIVVVEGIVAKMEQGMGARQAAFEAMKELTGALIATSLVLIAVFMPVVFFPGATGIMYKQFALIIIFSIAISTFNALSFSPSMAAILLKANHGEGRGPLAWFFRKFNQGFEWVLNRYRSLLEFLIRIRMIVIGLFILGLAATYLMFTSVPSGFIPEEDQGLLIGIMQAPEGVSLNYSNQVAEEIYQTLVQEPSVQPVGAGATRAGQGGGTPATAEATAATNSPDAAKLAVIATGFGLDGSGPNKGTFFVRLKDWSERTAPDQSAKAIAQRLNQAFARNEQAFIQIFSPPAVPGFSATGGLEFQLQDRTGKLTFDEFLATAGEIIARANQHPALSGVFTQFTANTPQYRIDVDRNKLNSENVDFGQALSTLSAYFGSQYVNDFTLGQRNYRVYVQADQQFRNQLPQLGQIYIRSRSGDMVRLSDLGTVTPITGPSVIPHFNLYRAIKIQGNPAPGYSSGQAIAAMQSVFEEVAPPGMGYEWTGLTREEVNSGGQAGVIFLFGIVVVFLVLAAQYENFVDPVIILLTVPFAVLGAMLFLKLDPRGLTNDLYAQIALVMLIGLAAKNAILIVEFANQAREQGMTLAKAAVHAARERFRPILMTALSAEVGFIPLLTASGAGAASRWSLGTSVFGGLLVATLVNYLVTPVLYVVIKNLTEFVFGDKRPDPPSGSSGGEQPRMADLPEVPQPVSPVVRLQEGDSPA